MSGLPFPQNFYYSPIAYNSRSASIIPSGVDVNRPMGVFKDSSGKPAFQRSRKLDYELELGIIVSKPVPWGCRVSPDEAFAEHVFGYVLINDWSSRDIQPYESFPAGPFNSKSFATSMSNWVVMPEALEDAKAAPINQTMDCVPQHIRHAHTLGDTIYDIDVQAYMKRKWRYQTIVS
jgi:fumarylacetoacetase